MVRKLTKHRLSIFLAVLLIIQLLVLNTILNKDNEFQKEYENRLMLVRKYKEKLKELPEVKQKNKILKKELEKLKNKTFKGENDSIAYAELIGVINEILKELKIEGESILKLPTKSAGDFNIIRLNLRFRSESYKKVILFISKIERNEKKFIFFERLHLSTLKQSPKVVYLNLNANIGGVWFGSE